MDNKLSSVRFRLWDEDFSISYVKHSKMRRNCEILVSLSIFRSKFNSNNHASIETELVEESLLYVP